MNSKPNLLRKKNKTKATLMNEQDYADDCAKYFWQMRSDTSTINHVCKASLIDKLLSVAVLLKRGFALFFLMIDMQKIGHQSPIFVIYDSTRTPRNQGFSDKDFLRVLSQNNVKQSYETIFSVSSNDNICVFDINNISENNLARAVGQLLGWKSSLKILMVMILKVLRRQSVRQSLFSLLTLYLQKEFSNRPRTILLFTSNSFLIEVTRCAALNAKGTRVVEILHGISFSGLDHYYAKLAKSCVNKPEYVNLMAGLFQPTSLSHYMRYFGDKEVAINARFNAQQSSQGGINIHTSLLKSPFILIAGSSSHYPNYYETPFFEQEMHIIEHIQKALPDITILYSPHPANKPVEATFQQRIKGSSILLNPYPTTISLFFANAVIGTFSSSLFEAAAIGKPCLMLPYDVSKLCDGQLDDICIISNPSEIETALADWLAIHDKAINQRLNLEVVSKTAFDVCGVNFILS